jgi:sugar phosphate isomerase/epimerase
MHIADNTRRFPGSGQFDFQRILKALDEVGYEGYLSVECIPEPSGEEAAAQAIRFLTDTVQTL